MKTPDEIKKGLLICSGSFMYCTECPYHQTPAACMKLSEDALEYVLQLEFKLRDATEDVEHLENQLADAGKKVAQLEAAQLKWISVEDDLPEHAIIPCMIYADGYIQIAYWSHDKYGLAWWFFVDGEYETGVTHWMPLPEPPKEDA